MCALAIISISAVLIGCTGDGSDSASLEEYWCSLQVLGGGEEATPAPFPTQADSMPSFNEVKATLVGYYDSALEPFTTYVAGFRQLRPPAEARDAHERVLKAYDDAISELKAERARIDGADSFEELGAGPDDSDRLMQRTAEVDQSFTELVNLLAEQLGDNREPGCR